LVNAPQEKVTRAISIRRPDIGTTRQCPSIREGRFPFKSAFGCATTIIVTDHIASRTNVTQFSMSDGSGDEAARELHTGEDELTGHLTAPGLHPTLQGS